MTDGTKRLREMLDERGIEYEQGCIDGIASYTHTTKWMTQTGNRCTYCEIEDGYPPYFTRMDIWTPTPEQAVEMTVGRKGDKAEVVRCRDCAHCEVHLDGSHVCGLTHLDHRADYFCYFGEREVEP